MNTIKLSALAVLVATALTGCGGSSSGGGSGEPTPAPTPDPVVAWVETDRDYDYIEFSKHTGDIRLDGKLVDFDQEFKFEYANQIEVWYDEDSSDYYDFSYYVDNDSRGNSRVNIKVENDGSLAAKRLNVGKTLNNGVSYIAETTMVFSHYEESNEAKLELYVNDYENSIFSYLYCSSSDIYNEDGLLCDEGIFIPLESVQTIIDSIKLDGKEAIKRDWIYYITQHLPNELPEQPEPLPIDVNIICEESEYTEGDTIICTAEYSVESRSTDLGWEVYDDGGVLYVSGLGDSVSFVAEGAGDYTIMLFDENDNSVQLDEVVVHVEPYVYEPAPNESDNPYLFDLRCPASVRGFQTAACDVNPIDGGDLKYIGDWKVTGGGVVYRGEGEPAWYAMPDVMYQVTIFNGSTSIVVTR